MATQDWATSLDWGVGKSFRVPTEFEIARGSIPDAGKGAENDFTPNSQNAALLQSLGYGGDPLSGGAWSDDARNWLANSGYSLGVGHQPGTSAQGRAEYFGLLDPGGKFVAGQSDPTMSVSDTWGEIITPFALMAAPFAAAALGGAAGGGAAGTLGAAEGGVTALGSAWSPSALGLTTSSGLGAANAAAVSQLGGWVAPSLAGAGAAGGAAALGGGAGAGAGAGGVTATLPTQVITGTSAGAGGGLTGGQVLGGAATGAGAFTPSQNYGEGMNGLQTSAYDNTLGVTGSKGVADAVANSEPGASIWKSPVTKGLADMFSSYGSNSGWLDLLKGGMSLYQSSQMSKAGEPSAAAVTAGDQLAALLKDPSSLTKLPGYEAGLQAVQRSGAANGYLGSGNMMVGLSKYAGDFYNNTLRQLSSIANEGRGIDQQYNFASTALTGHAINNFGYGLTKLFGD